MPETSLEAQVEQTELGVQEVEVVVETFARLQAENQFLLFPVAAHKVGEAGFNCAPDTDEAGGQAIAAGEVAGQEFLALAAGVQKGQRTLVLSGQLVGGGAHAIRPAAGEGGKVLEQHVGAAQITQHQAGLIKGTQGGHETKPVKARKNARDVRGMLRYKGRRDVAGRGVDFDFHTQVLPHWRRPVCRFNVVAAQAALGLSVSIRG